MKYKDPIFKFGDESKFEITNEMVLAYSKKFRIKEDDSNMTRIIKQEYLKQGKQGVLFEMVKDAWISDAKERGLWKPEPFPEVDIRKMVEKYGYDYLKVHRRQKAILGPNHKRPSADKIVLTSTASRYVFEDNLNVKKIWFNYKEKWLHRKILPELEYLEWNNILDMIQDYKRGN